MKAIGCLRFGASGTVGVLNAFPLFITVRQSFGFGALVLCAGFTGSSQASGFIDDTTANIESRTMYFNRDFRDGHTSTEQGASKRDESAQGFILNLQSGYTEGTVGFGIDALGMAGFKLDSSPDSSNSGLLPSSGENRAVRQTNTPSSA
jgi:hypothetical protein